jgi:hypothetical protein
MPVVGSAAVGPVHRADATLTWPSPARVRWTGVSWPRFATVRSGFACCREPFQASVTRFCPTGSASSPTRAWSWRTVTVGPPSRFPTHSPRRAGAVAGAQQISRWADLICPPTGRYPDCSSVRAASRPAGSARRGTTSSSSGYPQGMRRAGVALLLPVARRSVYPHIGGAVSGVVVNAGPPAFSNHDSTRDRARGSGTTRPVARGSMFGSRRSATEGRPGSCAVGLLDRLRRRLPDQGHGLAMFGRSCPRRGGCFSSECASPIGDAAVDEMAVQWGQPVG